MKMVTMSLEVHYIPVKKLAMIYTKILANLFYHGVNGDPKVHPQSIFSCK